VNAWATECQLLEPHSLDDKRKQRNRNFVLFALRKGDCLPIALKFVRDRSEGEREVQLFETISKFRDHPLNHIVPFVTSLCPGDKLAMFPCIIVTERTATMTVENWSPDKGVFYKFVTQLIEGVTFLHEVCRIAHRDIAPRNILVRCEWNELKVMIVDLGFGTWVGHKMTAECGTPDFMAPEIEEEEQYNELVDVFSAGKVVEHVFEKLPLWDDELPSVEDVKSFIQGIVQIDPVLRPSARNALDRWNALLATSQDYRSKPRALTSFQTEEMQFQVKSHF